MYVLSRMATHLKFVEYELKKTHWNPFLPHFQCLKKKVYLVKSKYCIQDLLNNLKKKPSLCSAISHKPWQLKEMILTI